MSSAIKRPRSLRGEGKLLASIAVGVGIAGHAAAAPMPAEEPPMVNETIVVTSEGENPYADPAAPYRVVKSANGLLTEDLIDTPKSVQVIPDSVIDDLGATSFRELFRSQPGVTLGTGEGGNAFGDRIFIRGFDARNDVFIDGVRDPGIGSREVFAVQQVEVMRGPSSTFGGRGTTGGAVNLVSKQPGATNFGDAELTLGSADKMRATVDMNRVVTDRFSMRVNAMYQESGVAGRDHVFDDRWGVAAAFDYRVADTLRFGFDYYHLSTDFMPDWGHPYDNANNRPFDVDRDNFYGVLDRDYGETFADVYTGRVDWAISDNIALSSVVRYGQSKNAYTASAPERPDAEARTVSANAKRRDAITDYWTNQTRLTIDFATGGITHRLVTGYELAREETLNRQRAFTECATLPCTGSASNPLLDLDHPDNSIPWGSDTEVTGRPVITVDTAAIYVIDTMTFSPQWEAFVGLRGDSYEASTSGLDPERQSESDYLNWHAGLVYKPLENGSIYLSYSSSSNPPCEQLDAFALDYGGCDARVTTFDPVENTSAELGTKWTLNEHLDLTAAIFQIQRDGVPTSSGRGASATLGEQDQEVSGVEIGVAGNLTDRWSLFGGVSVIDTEITDSTDAAQIGAKFPNVSELSLTLTSRFDVTDKLYLGGTANFNSEKYGGTTAAGTTMVPDYWRFDLFGGYQITERVAVSFNVLNVGDELYYDALYRSGTPFSYVAPGRSAQVTLDIDF